MKLGQWLAIGWTLLILAACSIPGSDIPSVSVAHVDKVVHFGFFAAFGWFWMSALRRPLPSRVRWVLAAGLAYAVFTEFVQAVLPFDRTPDPWDALADSLGLFAAVWLYRALYARYRRMR